MLEGEFEGADKRQAGDDMESEVKTARLKD